MSNNPVEKIRWWRPKGLPGLEALEADNCSQRWKVFHTTYTICQVWDSQKTFNKWHYRRRTFRSHSGAFMMMEPGEIHAVQEISAPGNFWVLMLDPSHFEGLVDSGNLRAMPQLKKMNGADPELWRAMYDFHLTLIHPASQLEKDSRLAEVKRIFLEKCCETPPFVSPDPEPGALHRAMDYLCGHSLQEVRLGDLAKEACVCEEHLCRLFKQHFWIRPSECQAMLRVEEVKKEIRQGTSLSDIMKKVGFHDLSHLNRVFKRFTGISPSAYQREITYTISC